MKIKIEGKQHLVGTSRKTGKPYDFIAVYYLGKQRGVEGLASQQVSLDPTDVEYEKIIVGMEYNLEFDNRGYPVSFDPVDKAAWEKAVAARRF